MNLLAGMLVGWVCAAVAALALKMNLPLPGRSRISSRRVHKYDAWSQWLAQANVHVTPVQFCAASLALGAAVYAVLSVVCGPVIALVPALAMGMVPRLYYGTSRRRRLTAAQRAWPDALRDVLTAEIGRAHV